MAIGKASDGQTSANADVARRDSLGRSRRITTDLKLPRLAARRHARERAMLMESASAPSGRGPESYPTGAALCGGIRTTRAASRHGRDT